MKHSTNLIIISGPSGSGKDSIIKKLIERGLPIIRVITSTTRPKRPNETNGKDYYFITKDEFQKKIDADEMSEWARVDNGRLYGVTKNEIKRVKSLKNKIGVWKIEYKGVKSAKKQIPDILSILIEPPNIKSLSKRIHKRGDKNEKEIKERIEYSQGFLRHKKLYDYSIINEQGKLDKTTDEVIDILKKEDYIDKNK